MRVFYDLTCPFCYLAQTFNKQLLKAGVQLTELPFQAHPDVPIEGKFMGLGRGPMYDGISARAKASNLPLKMRDMLPNSGLALAMAEWTRRHRPEVGDQVREELFFAHFAGEGELGVAGTPAWESGGSVISGLQEARVWKVAEKDIKEAE